MRRAARWFRRLPWWGKLITALIGLAGAGGSGVVGVVLYSQSQTNSTGYINRWFDDPGSRADIATLRRAVFAALGRADRPVVARHRAALPHLPPPHRHRYFRRRRRWRGTGLRRV
jgi:hypothetical protein